MSGTRNETIVGQKKGLFFSAQRTAHAVESNVLRSKVEREKQRVFPPELSH